MGAVYGVVLMATTIPEIVSTIVATKDANQPANTKRLEASYQGFAEEDTGHDARPRHFRGVQPDLTALNFDHLPTHMIDKTGKRTVWIRNSLKEKSQ